jgi:hypothetical protein
MFSKMGCTISLMMKVIVFWDVMPCRMIYIRIKRGILPPSSVYIYSEDGDNRFLQKVDKYLLCNMVSHRVKQ